MTIRSGQEYIDSLRTLKTKLFMFGEEVAPDKIPDHPMIRPAINSVAKVYEIAGDP